MKTFRLIWSAAKLAFLSLPEAGSWTLIFVRVFLVPMFSGLFYLLISSGGTGEFSASNGLTAAAAVGALSGIMAASSLTATDRFEGTISLIFIAPRSQGPVWFGRHLVISAIGLATSLVSAGVNLALTGFEFSARETGAAALALCAATVSSIGFGQFIGAMSYTLKDAYLLPNFSEYAMPLLCGVVAPIAVFPVAVQWLAMVFPLTHATNAIRELSEIGISSAFWTSLAMAVAVGLIWLILAVGASRYFKARARADGNIEALSV